MKRNSMPGVAAMAMMVGTLVSAVDKPNIILKERPIDGVDLIPYITGKTKGKPHQQLFWRAGTQHAARVGDWKLNILPRTPPMLDTCARDSLC